MPDAVDEALDIDARGLSKAYGRSVALRNVTLRVVRGASLAILGPNGSGKTTLIRTLSTLTVPDSGSARIGGYDVRRDGARVRRMIGVLTHDSLLYDDLTARENLRFAARMFGVRNADERIDAVTAPLGVAARLDERVGALSHGWKKRVSLARAILHDPPILLLDEPDSGLDQQALDALDALLRGDGRQRRTVVFTTHNLERARRSADAVVFLERGAVTHAPVDAMEPPDAYSVRGAAGGAP